MKKKKLKKKLKSALREVHELEAHEPRPDREKLIQAFAYATTVAVSGLWMAHNGRTLTSEETDRFTKVLFAFFVGLKQKDEETTVKGNGKEV